jgi:acetyl esterase
MAAPASSTAFRTLPVPGLGRDVRVWGTKVRGKTLPLVLHLHGGSFTTGDLDSGEQLATLIAAAGAVVASFDYPLAPQHRFPDAAEAAYATLEWLYRQRTALAGREAPMYVAGEEAGGNLAAAVAMMARDRRHPPLAGQVLVAPMLDPCTATPSLRDKLGEQLECRWALGWDNYLRGPMDAEHPYAVPGRAQRLVDLPRTLVLTGADDPMRDEAGAYARRLRAADVDVTCAMLQVPTGWPESLEQAATDDCPCAGQAKGWLTEFFQPPMPPPG